MDNRQVDALIHEKVFRRCAHLWLQHLSPMQCFKCGQAETLYSKTPYYSTDIAAAWQVVEKMREMCTESTKDSNGVDTDFETPFDANHFFERLHLIADKRWPWAFLYITPEAICLAALGAFGLEVKEGK